VGTPLKISSWTYSALGEVKLRRGARRAAAAAAAAAAAKISSWTFSALSEVKLLRGGGDGGGDGE